MRKGNEAMRFTRIIAGTITAGLVGLVPVAVSSPASATVDLTTSSTLTADPAGYTVGDSIFFTAGVVASDGAAPDYGLAYLQILTSSNPTWTTVATDDSASYVSFSDVTAVENAQYKVVYGGYVAQSTTQDNYAASESAPFIIEVAREVTASNASTRFFGKITPDYAKKSVKVERKFGKNWRKYKVIKTNSKGKWSIKLPAPSRKKTFWRFSIKSDAQFVGWSATGWTRRY